MHIFYALGPRKGSHVPVPPHIIITFSSACTVRMLVSFFSLAGFTSMSSSLAG